MNKLLNALGVIVLNKKIRKFLLETDPKALEQCENAINNAINEAADNFSLSASLKIRIKENRLNEKLGEKE